MPRPKRRAHKNVISRRDASGDRPLLQRILDTPHVESLIPRLEPHMLHRVIQTCGLEDCAGLVAMATPEQLQRVFDIDLWRADRPGHDERLDPDRFGVWLEVLLDAGAGIAAEKVAGIDTDIVVAALAHHVRVFDQAAVAPLESADGDEPVDVGRGTDRLSCEIGGYVIEATRTQSWDAIVAVLLELDASHPACFHRLVRGCRHLSNASFELDGLHDLLSDRDQDLFDLSVDREQRREASGFMPAPQARAFLESARQTCLENAAPPLPDPIARAYFRAIEWTPSPEPSSPQSAREVADFVEMLRDAGVVVPAPRALLGGGPAEPAAGPRLALIRAQLADVADRDELAFSERTAEAAYLANVLVAGCSLQSRPFSEREASDAVLAVCNLGLENWPVRWVAANGVLIDHDLVRVFQVGWAILYRDVCMFAARRLALVLDDLASGEGEMQSGIDGLRRALFRHCRDGRPWLAHDAFDALTALDMLAWAALLGLIAECPVMHGGMAIHRHPGARSVGASDFEFIAENSQIRAVHGYLQRLPEILRT